MRIELAMTENVFKIPFSIIFERVNQLKKVKKVSKLLF